MAAPAYAPDTLDEAPDLDGVPLDAHSQYAREALTHRLLSADEERELARRWREERDVCARDALVTHNLRLVYAVAQRYRATASMSRLDLVQEGTIGLMHALDKFDERTGNKLSTYATWWIRQHIDRAIAEKDRAIRIPVHVLTHAAEAAASGYTDEWLAQLRAVGSLDMTLPGGDDDARTLGATIPDEGSDGDAAAEMLCDADARAGLWRLCEMILTPREAIVIRLRFGIGGDPVLAREWAEVPLGRLRGNADRYVRPDVTGDDAPHTLADVGRLLHVSRERVRQIEAAALDKLRARLTRDGTTGSVAVQRRKRGRPPKAKGATSAEAAATATQAVA